MRKEIIGILLFFLVVFTLVSLLSYSPEDPSLLNAVGVREIHNLFGVFGSHLAGLLIGIFGLGAFWVPILLLLSSMHILGGHSRTAILCTIMGGLLLVVTTGGLLALKQHSYVIFGNDFSAGGFVGIC